MSSPVALLGQGWASHRLSRVDEQTELGESIPDEQT
jgi:hypothetical protein